MQKSIMWVALLVCIGLLPLSVMGLPLQLPLVSYVRGAIGELSVVTSLLLWTYFFVPQTVPTSFKLTVIGSALVFYPLALGLTLWDPYAWGYGSLPLLFTASGLACYFWLIHWERGTIIISVAILCWLFKLHESTNLWDYLLDPFLFMGCLLALVIERANRIMIK